MDDIYLAAKQHGNLIITVIPLTYGRARITVGFDWATYEDGW